MAWPVAGASTTIRSAAPSRSSCLTLPRTRTSRMPGMAVDTTSRTPECASRLDTRRRPWSSRYSIERVVGREPPGPHRARRPAARPDPAVRPAQPVRAGLPRSRGPRARPKAAGDAGLALELHDEDRFAGPGGHLGQRRAHRRLAHAALAGDDEDVALCAEGPHVHAGPSVVAGPAPQIDRRPKILVKPLESGSPRR